VADRFVIQLENVNDAPEPDAKKTIQAIEGGRSLRGKLEAVDPDGDPLTFSLAAFQRLAPGFSFQPDGQWEFNPADPFWRSIKGGAKRQVSMRFKATDPHGDSGNLTLTLDISGVNNPPEVEALAEVKLDQNAPPFEGQVKATDVDEDARLSFAVLGDKAPEGFTLQADGRWRFDPAQPSYQTLRKGEFRSMFVPIRVSDEVGGLAVVRLQITLQGVQQ
jgi:VCBS repeat-containing protein